MSPEPEVFMPKAHHQTGGFKRTEDPRAGQPDNLKMIELMGLPTPISFGEVYTAMQQGWWTVRKITFPRCRLAISKSRKCSLKMSMPPFLTSRDLQQNLDKLTPGSSKFWSAAKASEVYQQQLWQKIDADTRAQAKALGRNYQSG